MSLALFGVCLTDLPFSLPPPYSRCLLPGPAPVQPHTPCPDRARHDKPRPAPAAGPAPSAAAKPTTGTQEGAHSGTVPQTNLAFSTVRLYPGVWPEDADFSGCVNMTKVNC